MSRPYSYDYQEPRQNRGKLILFIIIGVIVWSLALMLLYTIADTLISWTVTGGSTLIDAGKSLAGKEATTAFDALNLGQFAEPAIAFLRASLAPVAWIIWAVGVILLLLLPTLIRQLRTKRKLRRH